MVRAVQMLAGLKSLWLAQEEKNYHWHIGHLLSVQFLLMESQAATCASLPLTKVFPPHIPSLLLKNITLESRVLTRVLKVFQPLLPNTQGTETYPVL